MHMLVAVVLALTIPAPPDGKVLDQTSSISTPNLDGIRAGIRGVKDKDDVELAVLMVESTEGVDASIIATAAYSNWHIQDRGALIFIAKSGAFYIRFGKGLSPIFPDSEATRIAKGMIGKLEWNKELKQGNFNAAIRYGINEIVGRVRSLASKPQAPQPVAAAPRPAMIPSQPAPVAVPAQTRPTPTPIEAPQQIAKNNTNESSSGSFVMVLVFLALAVLIIWIVRRVMRSSYGSGYDPYGPGPELTPSPPHFDPPPRYTYNGPTRPSVAVSQPVQVNVSSQQVVAPQSSAGDLLTGVALGRALEEGRHHHHHEPPRRRYEEPAPRRRSLPDPEPIVPSFGGSGGGATFDEPTPSGSGGGAVFDDSSSGGSGGGAVFGDDSTPSQSGSGGGAVFGDEDDEPKKDEGGGGGAVF